MTADNRHSVEQCYDEGWPLEMVNQLDEHLALIEDLLRRGGLDWKPSQHERLQAELEKARAAAFLLIDWITNQVPEN